MQIRKRRGCLPGGLILAGPLLERAIGVIYRPRTERQVGCSAQHAFRAPQRCTTRTCARAWLERTCCIDQGSQLAWLG